MQGPVIDAFKALSSYDVSLLIWPDAAAILGNLYFLIALCLIVFFFLVGLSITIKYSKHLLNDFKSISDSNIPDIAIKLWFGMVLVLPLFLDAGLVWFTVWWAIIFRGYINRAEMRLIACLLLIVIFSGWISGIGGNLVTYASTQASREIFLIEEGLETQDDISRLSDWVDKNSNDTEPMNALSLSKIRNGESDEAISLLRKCLTFDMDNPVFLNNIGIAFASQQNLKEASNAFKDAALLDQKEIIYLFNLSRAYQELLDFSDEDKVIEKMIELDPRETSKLLSTKTDPPYIYKKTPLRAMFSREMRDSEVSTLASNELWHFAFGIIKPEWAPWVGIVILAAFMLLGLIPKDKYSKKCTRCGNTFYVGSMTGKGYPICLQCNLIETRSKKQHSIVVLHKMQEIKNFSMMNRRKTARLEMILPGLGSMLANRTMRAIAFFLIFSTGLVLAASGCGFMYSFMPSRIDYTLYLRVAGIAILLVLYLAVLRYPPVKRGI